MIERRQIVTREEWLEWRRSDVTASDVASLFGLSPFKSALRLWAEKTGRTEPDGETNLMRRGRWLEPAVIAALSETMPVERLSFYYRDTDDRVAATPDAVSGRTLIECKVVSRPVFDAWQDELPVYYQLQALTAAMLMDADNAIVACLVIDTFSAELRLFHVERHADAEARIRNGIRSFWQGVADGLPPPADYGEDGELLAELYRPKAEILAIDLGSDNMLPGLLIERETIKAEIKARKKRANAIDAEVVEKLKGAPAALCGAWKITNKITHRPAAVVKATSFPVLRITKQREAAA